MKQGRRFITVGTGGHGRYEEKKSVFLAEMAHVTSQEEALDFIKEIHRKNYDARHNCYAWSIGWKQPELHASDDGEPSGTAGRPILDVLTGAGVTDAVLVVTRYFGGTLLGTGGLVRAYTAAARDCLDKSTLIEQVYGRVLQLEIAYSDVGRVQHFLEEKKTKILGTTYEELVRLQVIMPEEETETFVRDVTEMTAGRAGIITGENRWYAV